MKYLLIFQLLFFSFSNQLKSEDLITKHEKPLRIGIVGLSHDHVHGILSRGKIGDIEIVGIVESNRDLAQRYSKKYGFSMETVFPTLEVMLEAIHPEAVTAFNMISEHVMVVEQCAPRGIHVMVEKPLATTVEDSEKMISLARRYKIQLVTNFETSWYGSNTEAYKMVINEHKIGDIRKIIFYTGHRGPVEIGCSAEFLEWLTDPFKNGGGALTDFGCYGANLATWFMKGEVPVTVSCVTQQIKPEIYPKVEDEATIILTYPKAQVIIQASWNWPIGRKEMEIYGKTGYLICKNREDMLMLENEKSEVLNLKAISLPNGMNEPFAFFYNVLRGNYIMKPYSPSSPENNEIVMKILGAARYAQKTGKTVIWNEYFKSK